MVRGKLTNMRVLLQRANRDTDDLAVMQAVDQLKERLAAVEAKSLDQPVVWRAPDQRSIWVCSTTCSKVGHALRKASGVHRPIR